MVTGLATGGHRLWASRDPAFVASRADAHLESSIGTFLFNTEGTLQHADRASALHLPLADGSPGPALILRVNQTMDEGARFTDPYVEPYDEPLELNQDGSPPSTPCP
jgi:hypothetical protein